jgi:hypothetical protein
MAKMIKKINTFADKFDDFILYWGKRYYEKRYFNPRY